MSKVLKYLTGLLGLWLIVEISVFGARSALWIAFATARRPPTRARRPDARPE